MPSAHFRAIGSDDLPEKYSLRIERMHHGNVLVTSFDADFVTSTDYAVLSGSASTLKELMGPGAFIRRGEGERMKESAVTDFHQAMQSLRDEVERGVVEAEMNPEQLWETTTHSTVRRLLKVQIEDAIAANQIFTTLMGDEVEPRRNLREHFAQPFLAGLFVF